MAARKLLPLLGLFAALASPVAQSNSSDNQGGIPIGAYTVGNNPFGSSDVIIEAPEGHHYLDPMGCSASQPSSLLLVDTGDGTYKLILSQIIAAATMGQKVTFYLSNDCADLGWGIQLPRVIGIYVPARS